MHNPNYGWLFSDIVEGSISETGLTARTYVYEVWGFWGTYPGFKPCLPEEATMGFTVLYKNCHGICGDANNYGTVNISDAMLLINFVLAGGPPPQPVLLCGETNPDESIIVSDAV